MVLDSLNLEGRPAAAQTGSHKSVCPSKNERDVFVSTLSYFFVSTGYLLSAYKTERTLIIVE